MSDDYQWYNQVDTNKRESDINNRDIVPLTYKDGTTEYHYRGTAYKTEQEAIRAQQGPAWFNKAAGFVGKTLMSSPTISTVAKTVAPVLQNEFVQDALTGPGEDTVITHLGDSLVQYGLPRNLAEVGRAVYPGPMDAKAPKIKPTGLTPAPIGVVENVPTYPSINRVDTNIPTVYKAELLPPPVKTAELGPFPAKRSEGSALIKRQQDKLKSPEELKLERKEFTETYNIATQGPLKHHHKGDQYFAGKVANRTDSSTVFKMLEDQEGIVLGDKAQNIIGLADQKTYLRRTSAMESVSQQMGFKGLPKTGTAERRLLDDLFKETKGNQKFVTPKDPASYGLPRGEPTGTNTWAIGLNPDGSKVTNAQKLAAYENRFKYNKIDKSKIKYDRGGTIVSGDHIDLAHYTGIDSKDFTQRTELIKLFESGEHLKLSSLQLKNKITEVYRIQENIAVNVAVRRMKFVKDYIRNSGNIPPATRRMLLNDPNKLREWIVNNPGISGNIGWKLKNPTFKELSRTPSSQYLKEWRSGKSPLQIVFGKGASISRPKGWVERATSKQINKLKQNFNQKRL